VSDDIGEGIAADASIHLAASDFARDCKTYLWPMYVYWGHFHDKVKSYREQGLTHDADLLALHVPVMDDGLVCFADHDEPMWHDQCPVVRHLWPAVDDAVEEMRRSFQANPMPVVEEGDRD